MATCGNCGWSGPDGVLHGVVDCVVFLKLHNGELEKHWATLASFEVLANALEAEKTNRQRVVAAFERKLEESNLQLSEEREINKNLNEASDNWGNRALAAERQKSEVEAKLAHCEANLSVERHQAKSMDLELQESNRLNSELQKELAGLRHTGQHMTCGQCEQLRETQMCVRFGCGWSKKIHINQPAKTCGDFIEKRI